MARMVRCLLALSLCLLMISGTNMMDSRKVNSAKVGLDMFGKLAEVGRKSLKSKEGYDAVLKMLAITKNLGPLVSLGLGFASALFSLGHDSAQRTWMMKEFDQVNRGIESLDYKLDNIKKLMESLHSRNLAFKPLQELKATSRIIRSSRRQSVRHDKRIIQIWKSGGQLKALQAMYDLVKGDVLHNSLLKAAVEEADVGRLLEITAYMSTMLTKGFTDYVVIARTYYMSEEGMSESEAERWAQTVCLEEFQGEADNYYANIKKAINRAKANEKRVLEKQVREIISRNKGSSNKALSEAILAHIKDKFFWKNAAAFVYDDMYGFDNHNLWGHFPWGLHVHGRCWFVFWQDKDTNNRNNPDKDHIKREVAQIAQKTTFFAFDRNLAQKIRKYVQSQLSTKPRGMVIITRIGDGDVWKNWSLIDLQFSCTASCPFHYMTQDFSTHSSFTYATYYKPFYVAMAF